MRWESSECCRVRWKLAAWADNSFASHLVALAPHQRQYHAVQVAAVPGW